jgi:hypothetical protein
MVRAALRFHWAMTTSWLNIGLIESKQLTDVRRRVYNCR